MSAPDRACPDYPNECMHPWAHARTYAEVKATQTTNPKESAMPEEKPLGALPTPAEMIASANADLSEAYRALGDAADWLRSDWRTRPTTAEVEQIDRMRQAIVAAKAAINEGRP